MVGIAVADQILLCGSAGLAMSADKRLRAYGLPSPSADKRVFVYNRQALAGRVAPEGTGAAPLTMEPAVQCHLPAALAQGRPIPDVAKKSMFICMQVEKENDFSLDLAQAAAYRDAAVAQLRICSTWCDEVKAQLGGAEAARRNLQTYVTHIKDAVPPFLKDAGQVSARHKEAIDGLDSSFRDLAATKLHPLLREGGSGNSSSGGNSGSGSSTNTLMDNVSEVQLRGVSQSCFASHGKLAEQARELSERFDSLCSGSADLEMEAARKEVATLTNDVEEWRGKVVEQDAALQEESRAVIDCVRSNRDSVAQQVTGEIEALTGTVGQQQQQSDAASGAGAAAETQGGQGGVGGQEASFEGSRSRAGSRLSSSNMSLETAKTIDMLSQVRRHGEGPLSEGTRGCGGEGA
jgi:hypothetical protein